MRRILLRHLLMICLCLSFSFPVAAQAEYPTCNFSAQEPQSSQTQKLIWDSCSAVARQRKDEIDWDRLPPGSVQSLLWSTARCLQGVGDSASSLIAGLKDLAKLVAVDLPKAAYDETKQTVGWLWQKAQTLFGGASDAARANAGSYRSPLARARERAAALNKLLFEVFPKAIKEAWSDFACMPAPLQAKALCQIEVDVFLTFVSPEGVVQGSSWLQKAAAMTKTALSKMKYLPEFEAAGNLARKLDGLAGKYASRGWKILDSELSVPGKFNLYSAEDQAERKFLIFERMVKNPTTKKNVWIVDKLGKDAATGALDGRTEVGREFLQTLVETSHPDKQAVVFLDVNHLGKVNYFPGGAQAGDAYLKAVAHAAESAIREMKASGHVFRHGGDELTLHIAESSPKQVREIEQKIIDRVHSDPEVRRIFRAAKKDQAGALYQQIRNARTNSDLPASLTKRAGDSKLSFKELQTQLLEEQTKALKELASVQPSVSIGGAMVRKGETAEAAIARADQQAGKLKMTYKQEIGADTTKYGGTASSTTTRNLKAKPEAAIPEK